MALPCIYEVGGVKSAKHSEGVADPFGGFTKGNRLAGSLVPEMPVIRKNKYHSLLVGCLNHFLVAL